MPLRVYLHFFKWVDMAFMSGSPTALGGFYPLQSYCTTTPASSKYRRR